MVDVLVGHVVSRAFTQLICGLIIGAVKFHHERVGGVPQTCVKVMLVLPHGQIRVVANDDIHACLQSSKELLPTLTMRFGQPIRVKRENPIGVEEVIVCRADLDTTPSSTDHVGELVSKCGFAAARHATQNHTRRSRVSLSALE